MSGEILRVEALRRFVSFAQIALIEPTETQV